jgi:ATP-dependent RNA helicase DeaD
MPPQPRTNASRFIGRIIAENVPGGNAGAFALPACIAEPLPLERSPSPAFRCLAPLLARPFPCKYSRMDSFSPLGLPENLAAALTSFGFAGPTAAQERAIPILLAGRDLLLQAETGTGKTFAYLAPGLALAAGKSPARGPLLLVVCPTQELAVQVAGQAERLLAASGHTSTEQNPAVLALLGGSPLSRQETSLRRKPAVVVGTAGRLADLVRIGALKTASLNLAVLDEADRLFTPETEEAAAFILGKFPETCTRALVSATLSTRTKRLAAPFLRDPASTDLGGEGVLSSLIEHWAFYVDHRKRIDFIRRFDSVVRPERCLVFASRSDRAAQTVQRLIAEGLTADSILAKQDKEHRRVALDRFASGKVRYLVTSDLGARGLDVPGISHVLSLDLPEEPSVYTHRAGRTGRAGAKGVSVVLADGVELQRASRIAVRGAFVFRCKTLDSGALQEPPVEEFFSRVESAESEKSAYRAAHRGRRPEAQESRPPFPRPGHRTDHSNDRGPDRKAGPRR